MRASGGQQVRCIRRTWSLRKVHSGDEHGVDLRSSRGTFDPHKNHVWCSRCNIQDHRLQKLIGRPNECEMLPKGTYCEAAKQWWYGKLNTMAISFAFAWLGAWTAGLNAEAKELSQQRANGPIPIGLDTSSQKSCAEDNFTDPYAE